MAQLFFKHFSQFPMQQWRWPDFSPQELASKREGELLVDTDALDKLQALRKLLGKPIIITSAYRSEAHNNSLPGAAKNSFHRKARAFDVVMANHNPAEFEAAAKHVGFTGFGHYPKSGFMHIDTGNPRRWNDGAWFPSSKTQATPSFQTEPKVTTVSEILKRPETLTAAGGLLTGAGAVSQGNGPVQMGLGVVLVILAVAFAGWLLIRTATRPKDV